FAQRRLDRPLLPIKNGGHATLEESSLMEEPESISGAEHEVRSRRLSQVAHQLGFVGKVEYRHVYSRSGGAQYCVGPSVEYDQLVGFAEAFERDANPHDFALEAIIAHE